MRGNVRAGMGVLEVAVSVEAEIVKRGGQPAFPTGIGVNEVTAHYAPQAGESARLGENDLVKIDYGVHIDGYVADTSLTVSENPNFLTLMEATQRALQSAIDSAKRDRRIGEMSKAIESVAAKAGFKPISNLSGHTLLQYTVHAGKSIPNEYSPNLPMLKKGDVFAVEPFLTLPDAAGYVVEGKQETIFSIMMRKKTGIAELDNLTDMIWNSRKTLPFTPRWFEKDYSGDKLMRLLKELEQRRLLRSYPVLVEASGKPVAQFEHTLAYVDDGDIVVLT